MLNYDLSMIYLLEIMLYRVSIIINLFFDSNTGNFDVLLANIGVLTASSFSIAIAHIRKSIYFYIITIFLGIVFLLNQVDELFSLLHISGSEELSMILFCLYTHLSHLIISILIFFKYLIRPSNIIDDNHILFISAYWHLVEVVWIAILVTIVGF